ncbi:MAG: hypothetical protein OXC65_01340 [Thiotrichales bacterium]|nr:hypothetical protein [Thiotrichales bacterium]
MKIQWRKNVLVLVLMGYGATLFIFALLMWVKDMDASGAYDIVSAPLMALVGGSLAIAKDLIGSEDEDSSNVRNNQPNDGNDKQGHPAPDEQNGE